MKFTESRCPQSTPESEPFWEAASNHTLRIQCCSDCSSYYFPPSPICPYCSSRSVEWRSVSGEATLYSYVLTERPYPEWGVTGPMSVALIQLKEGPRMVSSVVDCDQTPTALVLDMPLVVTFRPFGSGLMLPCFRPANVAPAVDSL